MVTEEDEEAEDALDDVERGVVDRTTLSIDLSYNEAVAE